MARYSFTIEIKGIDPAGTQYEDALYEAGCGDALVAVINGRMMIDFDREASSYEGAVASAVRDMERAGAQVVHVSPLAE